MTKSVDLRDSPSWWVARLSLALLLLILYGWTIFEPYSGDALMHMMDDTQIHSLSDLLRTFYGGTNPVYQEQHRLTGFHRPVFNELYVIALKVIFGVGSVWLRVMTLAMLVGIAWVFLSLMQKMQVSVLPAVVGTAWLVFSPPLFFGLYEYGLAFSQLLVLLAVISLWALKKYIDCHQQKSAYLWLVIGLLFVFLAVFTKESAVVWSIICLVMIVFFANDKKIISDKKILSIKEQLKSLIFTFFALRWLALALIAIIIFYFVTRYIKLGSLTAIAGGIEQTPSLIDATVKFVGYTLLALQIPSFITPAYMTQSLQNLSWIEIALRLFLFFTALWALWNGWRKSWLATLSMLIAFFLAFLPIIKVSRNAPNYGDMMAILLAVALGLGFQAIKERASRFTYITISVLSITSLFVVSVFFEGRYIYNPDMWLARSQGFARAALSDFASAESVNDAKQIVGTSGLFSREQNWSLNYNSGIFGSGFIVNLGIPYEKFVLNSEKLLQNENLLFIDFYPEMQPRKVGAYPLPGYGRLITAYFPSGFIRKALESSDGTFNIKGNKVVRIECDNPYQKPFDVAFKLLPESELLRRVDSAMNINLTQDRLVLEFVAPANSFSLRLLGDDGAACQSPRVSGYSPLEQSSLSYTTLINASPRFENDSDWNGKLTRSPGGPGVIVGPGAVNPNVLSQRVWVKPFEHLKIIARAVSVDNSMATGRLQINWVDKNDKTLSSAGRTIELTQTESIHEAYVVAPAEAVAGYLYVTPHAPQDIVRYLEMTMIKGEL